MQIADIEQQIRTYLVDTFLLGRADGLNDENPLLGNVIDSQGVIEFVTFLQDRFSITVEDEEVNTENLDSVRKAVAFVDKKLRATTVS